MPLTGLWGPLHDAAFEQCMDALRHAVELNIIAGDDTLVVKSDASRVGWAGFVAACDAREMDKPIAAWQLRPAAFGGGVLNKTELAWSVPEKEVVAQVRTMQKAQHLVDRPQPFFALVDALAMVKVAKLGDTAASEANQPRPGRPHPTLQVQRDRGPRSRRAQLRRGLCVAPRRAYSAGRGSTSRRLCAAARRGGDRAGGQQQRGRRQQRERDRARDGRRQAVRGGRPVRLQEGTRHAAGLARVQVAVYPGAGGRGRRHWSGRPACTRLLCRAGPAGAMSCPVWHGGGLAAAPTPLPAGGEPALARLALAVGGACGAALEALNACQLAVAQGEGAPGAPRHCGPVAEAYLACARGARRAGEAARAACAEPLGAELEAAGGAPRWLAACTAKGGRSGAAQCFARLEAHATCVERAAAVSALLTGASR